MRERNAMSKNGIVLVGVFVSFAVVVAVSAAVRAGTLPDISGTWYAYGSTFNRCSISQSGSSVSLTNERGATASGTFSDPGTLNTNWGVFNGGQIIGHISGDLRTITWNNGTYWTRGSGGGSGSAAVTATPTPYPWRYIGWSSEKIERSPIHVVSGWAAVKLDGMWVTGCVSFKNTSSMVAKAIRFEFPLENHNEHVEMTVNLNRNGTFSPDIGIYGYDSLDEVFKRPGHHDYIKNCWGEKFDTSHDIAKVSKVRYFTYRVARIEFADGTEWPEPTLAAPTPTP